MLVIQLQCPDKCCLQFGKEVERSPEESNMSADRFSAGKAGDRLVDHRLKNGSGKIFFGSAVIDQRLDICLGKDTAACGNGIDRPVMFGVFVQS